MRLLGLGIGKDSEIKPASRFEFLMSEQFLDVANGTTIPQQVRGHRMAYDVRRNSLGDTRAFCKIGRASCRERVYVLV